MFFVEGFDLAQDEASLLLFFVFEVHFEELGLSASQENEEIDVVVKSVVELI